MSGGAGGRVRGAALLLCALALGAAAPLRAQANTEEMLQRAIHLYEQLDIERALTILDQVVSPSATFEVTDAQRARAYKYLGAILALKPGAAARDSAVRYFRAAIERDPFVDLDPRSFSPAQIAALAEARDEIFVVAVQPLTPDTTGPGLAPLAVRGVTTHAATLRVELRSGGVTRRVLYAGPNAGVRDITWDGTLADGTPAPPGRYELVLVGRSTLHQGLADSAADVFDVSLSHAPLEDTLPSLGHRDLLPEASEPRLDLLKGLGVAAAALLVQRALSASALGPGRTALSGVVGGAGVAAGLVAYFAGRARPAIPANVAENARRREARAAANAAIERRNAAVLSHAKVIVTPVTGGGP